MEIKQLKASMQLAQMRLDSDPSDANKSFHKQAKSAYEKALKDGTPKAEATGEKVLDPKDKKPASAKTESPKIKAASVKTEEKPVVASTETSDDESGDEDDSENEENSGEDTETENTLPANTETSGDTGSEQEKKTE